jgi:hypothetical protein
LSLVEIAGEAEEMGFDLSDVLAEGGHGSDADGGGISFGVDGAAAGVDAVGGDLLVVALEVGGGDAELAAAREAFADGSGEKVRTAEADGGVADAAEAQEESDERAADVDDLQIEQRNADGFDDVERDGGIGGPFTERVDGAGSAFAEAEGCAFDEMGGADIVAEDFPELSGLEVEDFGFGGEDDEEIDAAVLKEKLFYFWGREAKGGLLGANHVEGVRLKGDDGEMGVGVGGKLAAGLENAAVAEMDAVKVSDGEDGIGGEAFEAVKSVKGFHAVSEYIDRERGGE